MNWKTPGPRERGAVAVLTAIIVMFVAVGMLALSVDLGRITYDRAQLQNGADAGALAIAANCAAKPGQCTSDPSQIQTLVDMNANLAGGAQDLTAVGRETGKPPICFGNYTVAPACPTSRMTDLRDCLRLPEWVTSNHSPYVEVRTRTKTSSGTILPAIFGPSPGTTQMTCSRAAWGAAGSTGKTVPVTMSLCDWSKATADGTKYAPPPAYVPGPSASQPAVPASVSPYVTAIFTHHDKNAETCGSNPGQTYSGGFGFLDDSGQCTATILVDSTVHGDTGADAPSGCKYLLKTYLGKVVAIPIYDAFTEKGTNGTYTVAGISMFYFAGYTKMPSAQGQTEAVYSKPSTVCPGCKGGSNSYLWGWFTTGLLPVTASSGEPGNNYGASQIYPAG